VFLIVTANSVYMTDMPPPYPGINAYNGYAAASAPPLGAVGFNQPPPGAQSAAGKCTSSVVLGSYDVN
jgi:hypothetical protein